MTHKHDWFMNLSAAHPALVFCKGCGVSFKPETQQIPYKGKVPEKYAIL